MKNRNAMAVLFMLLFGGACLAHAQAEWPSRPIRVIVPFPAGGQLDSVIRLVTEKLVPVLGQPIVVENRTGADGNIGSQLVARSAPDGYTWLAQSAPYTIQASLRPQALGYSIRDLQPVISVGSSTFVLVVPTTLPVKTLEDFVAYAKARPDQLSYAGSAVGTTVHLSTEMFQHAAGTRMLMIPYPGIPPALADLVAGRTQFMSVGVVVGLPLIRAGKLRPLAVLDSERHPLLPDVPTTAEKGYPKVTVSTWFGLLVPANTPRSIVQRINTELAKIAQSPEVLARYQAMGVDPVKLLGPEAFEAQLKSELERWAVIIKQANIKAD